VAGSTKGIEQELIQLGRDGVTAAKMLKMADSLYGNGLTRSPAVGLITEHKAPHQGFRQDDEEGLDRIDDQHGRNGRQVCRDAAKK